MSIETAARTELVEIPCPAWCALKRAGHDDLGPIRGHFRRVERLPVADGDISFEVQSDDYYRGEGVETTPPRLLVSVDCPGTSSATLTVDQLLSLSAMAARAAEKLGQAERGELR